ncbi:MAG: universal stress protein [Euryarchaeota archaeon]|nr:universal stress protein [Euryarchaeota archaeon]
MYTHILIATDGSFHAKRAEDRALELAKGGAGVTGLYVIDRARYQWAEELMQDIYRKTRAEGEAVLSAFREKAQRHGLEVETKLREGTPSEEIIREAREGGYDLIVLGSRGTTPEALALGSVVQRVVRRAPCDVLVVRG